MLLSGMRKERRLHTLWCIYLILLDKLLRVHVKSYTPVILLPNTDMMTRGNGYLALKVYSEEWVSCAFSIEEYLGNKDN